MADASNTPSAEEIVLHEKDPATRTPRSRSTEPMTYDKLPLVIG